MSPPRPSLFKVETWASWEGFCTKCLLLALKELGESPALPPGENALNATLHDCLRRAAKNLRPDGPYGTIGYECPPQPFGESEESARRLKACPDFVWGFVDHREPNVLFNAREFVIECKRLRKASLSWKFNENYVEDGVRRFIDPVKKYGVGVSSGVMVGYLQDMEGNTVLEEVNNAAERRGIAILILSTQGWRPAAVSLLDHELKRLFPGSPFRLHHLWVDLCGKHVGKPGV